MRALIQIPPNSKGQNDEKKKYGKKGTDREIEAYRDKIL